MVRSVLVGTIILWYGAYGTWPSTWYPCNGRYGTPDLRDRFVIGAGSTYNPGDAGGNSSHRHNVAPALHRHPLIAGTDIAAGGDYKNETLLGPAAALTATTDALPPYVSLIYLQYTGKSR